MAARFHSSPPGNRSCRFLSRCGLALLIAAVGLLLRDWWPIKHSADDLVVVISDPFSLSGAIDTAGQVVIPFEYAELRSFNQFGLAIARITAQGKAGCLDRTGATAIPFDWDTILEFDGDGFAWASRDNDTCRIDVDGRIVERYPFRFIPPFDEHGMAKRRGEDGLSLVNHQGDKIGSGHWSWIGTFDDHGLAVVHTRQDSQHESARCGWIDRKGQIQIEPVWESCSGLREYLGEKCFDSRGWCQVSSESGSGWIDRNGQVVLPIIWKNARAFVDFPDGHESLAAVENESGWGFINRSGEIVIPAGFSSTGSFDAEGLAAVAVGSGDQRKWGWINRSGKFVIAAEWDEAWRLHPNGLAEVRWQNLWGCVDREGHVRIKPQWHAISVWNWGNNSPWRHDGIHVVHYDPDQWKILDTNGNELLDLGMPSRCRSFGFDPSTCERSDFGFNRWTHRTLRFGNMLSRAAYKLPLPYAARRRIQRMIDPISGITLEREVLDNAGRRIWRNTGNWWHRLYSVVCALAGGCCLAWSFWKRRARVGRSKK